MADFDDDDSGDFVSHKPWMGVAIPFSIVIAIIFCCVLVFYHRRNVKMQRNGLSLDRQGRMALQRDILPSDATRPYANGYYADSSNYGFRDHADNARFTGGRRQPRVANRWAWASNAERGVRPGRTAAQSEGLDENGQAPPPYVRYDNYQDKMAAEARAVEENIELSNRGVSSPAPAHVRGGSEASSSYPASSPATTSATAAGLSPSQTGSSPASSTSRPVTLPPAYSDVTAPKGTS